MDGNDGNWSISTSREPGIPHKTSQRAQGPTEGTTSPMPLNKTARLAGEGGDGYCSPPRLGTGPPRRRGEEALPPRGEREAGGRSTSPKTERRDRSTAGSRTDKPAIFLVSAHRGFPPPNSRPRLPVRLRNAPPLASFSLGPTLFSFPPEALALKRRFRFRADCVVVAEDGARRFVLWRHRGSRCRGSVCSAFQV